MSAQIKVFAVSYCDSVAAESLEEAVRHYRDGVGCELDEICQEEFGEAHEISEEQLRRQGFFDEDSGFRGSSWDYLQKLIVDGVEFPCLFGCSEC